MTSIPWRSGASHFAFFISSSMCVSFVKARTPYGNTGGSVGRVTPPAYMHKYAGAHRKQNNARNEIKAE